MSAALVIYASHYKYMCVEAKSWGQLDKIQGATCGYFTAFQTAIFGWKYSIFGLNIGLGPYSRPPVQFFPIRTSRPANNIYISYYRDRVLFVCSLLTRSLTWNQSIVQQLMSDGNILSLFLKASPIGLMHNTTCKLRRTRSMKKLYMANGLESTFRFLSWTMFCIWLEKRTKQQLRRCAIFIGLVLKYYFWLIRRPKYFLMLLKLNEEKMTLMRSN